MCSGPSVHTNLPYMSWKIYLSKLCITCGCRNFRKPRRARRGNNAMGNPTLQTWALLACRTSAPTFSTKVYFSFQFDTELEDSFGSGSVGFALFAIYCKYMIFFMIYDKRSYKWSFVCLLLLLFKTPINILYTYICKKHVVILLRKLTTGLLNQTVRTHLRFWVQGAKLPCRVAEPDEERVFLHTLIDLSIISNLKHSLKNKQTNKQTYTFNWPLLIQRFYAAPWILVQWKEENSKFRPA